MTEPAGIEVVESDWSKLPTVEIVAIALVITNDALLSIERGKYPRLGDKHLLPLLREYSTLLTAALEAARKDRAKIQTLERKTNVNG